MNKTDPQFIEISSDHANRRIDNFLFTQFSRIPKSHLYRLLREGQIRVNKKRVKPKYRVQTGDILRMPPLQVALKPRVNQYPLLLSKEVEDRILYEDEDLIVINKPCGLAVHGGSEVSVGLIQILRAIRPNVHNLELVHRLDRNTSGCLIIAKKHQVLRELHQLLRNGQIRKVYYALTKGHWPKRMNRIEAPLQKNVVQSGERMVRVHETGKKAVTEFRVVREFEGATFVEIRLKTGRMHQIRVHAQYAGHPVAGDDKYGDKVFNKIMRQKGLHRLFLHAHRIDFVLPSTGKSISVKAPLGQDLQEILNN